MQKHEDLMEIKHKDDDSSIEQGTDPSRDTLSVVSHLSDYDYYVDSDFWIRFREVYV